MKKFLLVALIIGFFGGSAYVAHKVGQNNLEKFKTINDSLHTANDHVMAANDAAIRPKSLIDAQAFREYDEEIQSKAGRNKTLASNAQSLVAVTRDAIELLQDTKASLNAKDTAGKNTHLGEQLLANTELGDSIRKALLDVSALCRISWVSTDKKATLDSILAPISWKLLQSDLKGTPTLVVLVRLSHLESQCQRAANLTLADIDEHLK